MVRLKKREKIRPFAKECINQRCTRAAKRRVREMTTGHRMDLCDPCYFAVMAMFLGSYVNCTTEVKEVKA